MKKRRSKMKSVSNSFARRFYNKIGSPAFDMFASQNKAAARKAVNELYIRDDDCVSKAMVYCPLGFANLNVNSLITFRYTK